MEENTFIKVCEYVEWSRLKASIFSSTCRAICCRICRDVEKRREKERASGGRRSDCDQQRWREQKEQRNEKEERDRRLSSESRRVPSALDCEQTPQQELLRQEGHATPFLWYIHTVNRMLKHWTLLLNWRRESTNIEFQMRVFKVGFLTCAFREKDWTAPSASKSKEIGDKSKVVKFPSNLIKITISRWYY